MESTMKKIGLWARVKRAGRVLIGKKQINYPDRIQRAHKLVDDAPKKKRVVMKKGKKGHCKLCHYYGLRVNYHTTVKHGRSARALKKFEAKIAKPAQDQVQCDWVSENGLPCTFWSVPRGVMVHKLRRHSGKNWTSLSKIAVKENDYVKN